MVPLNVWGENPSLLLPDSGGSWHSLDCGCITLTHFCVFTGPSPCLSVCMSSPCLIRIPVTGFKAHSKSRMILSQQPQLITSTKTLFPNKLYSEFPGGREFWRDAIQPDIDGHFISGAIWAQLTTSDEILIASEVASDPVPKPHVTFSTPQMYQLVSLGGRPWNCWACRLFIRKCSLRQYLWKARGRC